MVESVEYTNAYQTSTLFRPESLTSFQKPMHKQELSIQNEDGESVMAKRQLVGRSPRVKMADRLNTPSKVLKFNRTPFETERRINAEEQTPNFIRQMKQEETPVIKINCLKQATIRLKTQCCPSEISQTTSQANFIPERSKLEFSACCKTRKPSE